MCQRILQLLLKQLYWLPQVYLKTNTLQTILRLIDDNTESKTEFIEEDGRDPHLHANLQSLGPVTIPPTITKMRQVVHNIRLNI